MGSKGLVGHAGGGGGACADPGGGEAGGLDPIGKSHVIWVDLDPNPLIPLTKFPGSAQWGVQFISLEWIRTDCLMEDQARGESIPARGLGLAENDGFHMA